MDKVVVITVNYRQNDYTKDCISSLLESDYHNYSIMIIDNGSEPEYHKVLKDWVHNKNDNRLFLYHSKENIGYVGGINYGLKLSREHDPDYILIMNNDTIIDKHAMKELVQTCKLYDNKAIVSGKVYCYDNPDVIQNTGQVFTIFNRNPTPIGKDKKDSGAFDKKEERDMLDDIFWLFHCNLYKQIGGYSEYYWFNYEQADYAMRAKRNGYKLIYTPEAKIWHKSGAGIGGRVNNPVKDYFHTQSDLIYHYLHFPLYYSVLNYIKINIRFVIYLCRACIGKNKFKSAIGQFLGILYFHRWLMYRNKNTGYIPMIIKPD